MNERLFIPVTVIDNLLDKIEPENGIEEFINFLNETKSVSEKRGISGLRIEIEYDYDYTAVRLVGHRMEDDNEYERRLRNEQKKREAEEAAILAQQKKEYQEYLKLKKKFEKDSEKINKLKEKFENA